MAAGDEQDQELVLVVDDEDANRRLLAKILDRSGYRCITAGSIAEARDRMNEERFALVLSDMNMPGGSGLDLLMDVSTNHPETAILLVTGVVDQEVAKAALEMGAYGYITKPFSADQILIDVAGALRRRRLELENRNHRTRLEQMVRDRTQEMLGYISRLEEAEKEMKTLQKETIARLSMAAEFRDDDTPRHVQRVSRYSSMIAERVGEGPERADLIGIASSMHDVGKIGIPDTILMKPGKLTDDEWEIMKRHCEIGHRLLSGTTSEILNTAATVALTHHERIDGSGYPAGLRGEDIPIEGRIAAVADVFDALTSNRVYSRAISASDAAALMREGRGTQFDETCLDIFLGSMGVVLGIKERFADAEPLDAEVLEDIEADPRRVP